MKSTWVRGEGGLSSAADRPSGRQAAATKYRMGGRREKRGDFMLLGSSPLVFCPIEEFLRVSQLTVGRFGTGAINGGDIYPAGFKGRPGARGRRHPRACPA